MIMNKKFIWLVTLLLTLILGQSSYADCDKNQKHCNKFNQLTTELNLTAEQQEKVKEFKKQSKNSMKESYKQLKDLHNQIDALVTADKIDETKLDGLINQINQIRGAMLKNRIMIQHQVYTILTPEQKTKFQELKKQWGNKND